MILGIGLDVVNVDRFGAKIQDTPRLLGRLLSSTEQTGEISSLAGRFAVKEAVIKAFGGVAEFAWHDIEVGYETGGRPLVHLTGGIAALARERGVTRVHVSISHDPPVASAMVLLESHHTDEEGTL